MGSWRGLLRRFEEVSLDVGDSFSESEIHITLTKMRTAQRVGRARTSCLARAIIPVIL